MTNSEQMQPRNSLIRRLLAYIVFGANDGVINSFAIEAGVAGASLSRQVALILGFASVLADGFSMATSNYLSKGTPSNHEHRVRHRKAAKHGVATFLGFVIPGVFPPWRSCFHLIHSTGSRWQQVLTLITLFLVGASRAAASELMWGPAGPEMLLVGTCCSCGL